VTSADVAKRYCKRVLIDTPSEESGHADQAARVLGTTLRTDTDDVRFSWIRSRALLSYWRQTDRTDRCRKRDRLRLADSVEKLLFLAATISPTNAHPIENW